MRKSIFVLSMLCTLFFMSCLISGGEDGEKKAYDYFVVNAGDNFATISTVHGEEVKNNIQTTCKYPTSVSIVYPSVCLVDRDSSKIMFYDNKNFTINRIINLPEGIFPMNVEKVYDKLYVTSIYGTGIDVYRISDNSQVHIATIPYPEEGSCGADQIAVKDNYLYVNRNNYSIEDDTYGIESILKIDTYSDEIKGSIDVGVNVTSMCFDSNGRLHVLCSGNNDDIKGKIVILDVTSSYEMNIIETLNFDNQISCLRKDLAGYYYLVETKLDSENNIQNSVLKYNSSTLEIINGSENPVMITDSRIEDLFIWGETLFVPLYDYNKIQAYKDHSLLYELETGIGPKFIYQFFF
ncbi:MAG: hypothetical protein JXR48_13900 [Candidatus Delongbacteria bacterium]|nr:hypothetical protein [Candidatus Delongbacteria bacterium]MBN2836049.1 hypothetical protein [Candidatus Delongbacteria bacterium]